MTDRKLDAATSLLAEMLMGITQRPYPTHASNQDRAVLDEIATVALDDIHGEGTTVSAKMFMPSGDVYKVTVEWLNEESP